MSFQEEKGALLWRSPAFFILAVKAKTEVYTHTSLSSQLYVCKAQYFALPHVIEEHHVCAKK